MAERVEVMLSEEEVDRYREVGAACAQIVEKILSRDAVCVGNGDQRRDIVGYRLNEGGVYLLLNGSLCLAGYLRRDGVFLVVLIENDIGIGDVSA